MIRVARNHGYRTVAVVKAPPVDESNLAAVVEGSIMGTWEQRSRQSGEKDRVELEELILLGFGLDREREVVAAEQLGEATNRAREWVNLPANQKTPEFLAEEARRMARRYELEIEVLGPEELRAGGYNLPPAARSRGRTDAGADRQGHHLRFRRHLDQESRGDAPDEGRHGRRRGRS